MLQHHAVSVIASPYKGIGKFVGLTINPSEPSTQRMGYFFWLKESTDTINAAKVTANINVSDTVMASPPGLHDAGHADRCALSPLSS